MDLKVASDFTTAPGPRYRHEGEFSGEEFRERLLARKVRECLASKDKLLVDLDGTAGYGTSFLEEAFGGLVRIDKIPLGVLDSILDLKSDDEPELIEEIREYMLAAEKKR